MKRLLDLSLRQLTFVAGVALVLSAVKVCLWLLPFRATLRVWRGPNPARRKVSESSRERMLTEVEAVVPRVARRIMRDRPCLVQAVAARYLLALGGVDAELHIGVARDQGAQIKAHAWVQHNDRVVVGGIDVREHYVALKTPDHAGL